MYAVNPFAFKTYSRVVAELTVSTRRAAAERAWIADKDVGAVAADAWYREISLGRQKDRIAIHIHVLTHSNAPLYTSRMGLAIRILGRMDYQVLKALRPSD